MDPKAIRDLYDAHERRGADYPGFRREDAGDVVRMISDDGFHNAVIHSRLTAADADAVIDRELAYFGRLGLDFEWKWYSWDAPADLSDRLAAHGFSVGEEEAILALDLAEAPAAWTSGAEERPFEVRKVATDADFADFCAVSAAVWPDDEDADALSAHIGAMLKENPESMSAYVAYVDGAPVCTGRIEFPASSPFASLWGDATLESYRRRGIYSAILAVRGREAIARGYRYLTIDASPMSRPIAERRGFGLLGVSRPCESPRSR